MNANAPHCARPRVLIIDSQPVMLQALHDTLSTTGLFGAIDGTASAASALARLEADPCIGVVIADPAAGDDPAQDFIAQLRSRHPEVLLVVFSADASHAAILAAFAAGVRGYITKDLPASVVTGAIGLVLSGQVYLPPALLGPADSPPLAALPQPGALRPAVPLPAATERALANLTPRQHEVLQCLMMGAPNKVIARRLGIAEGTVKAHLNTIFRVVGAATRTQTVLRLREYGLV